jgi:hypothetical protein
MFCPALRPFAFTGLFSSSSCADYLSFAMRIILIVQRPWAQNRSYHRQKYDLTNAELDEDQEPLNFGIVTCR